MRNSLLIALVWLVGCNFQNVEYRRWDANGQQIENVRMGKINFLYWFSLNDFSIHTDPLDVSLGNLSEKNDPNAVELGVEALRFGNKFL